MSADKATIASGSGSAPPVAQAIAVDQSLNVDKDDDSSYESEIASNTTSLSDSVTDFKFKNGRRYHAYKEGSYIYPNDEDEKDRLDLMHKTIGTSMSGKLFFSRLRNPKRILDIGTGTGIWAMEIGDKFPHADVLGNDLSPIQPKWVPPNVHFEIDDVEAPWTYAYPFDFIHCRTMSAAIRDWPRLMQQCFHNLAPGGYAEFIEYDSIYTSPDGSLKADSDLAVFNRMFLKAIEDNNIDPSPGPKLEEMMQTAGFVDVTVAKHAMPFGTWPEDRHLKQVGVWNLLMLRDGLEGVVNYLFGHHLGMSKVELDVACAKIRKGITDPDIHCMYWLYIVHGRKPMEGEEKREKEA